MKKIKDRLSEAWATIDEKADTVFETICRWMVPTAATIIVILALLTAWHLGRLFESSENDTVTIARCVEIDEALDCQATQFNLQKAAQVYDELNKECLTKLEEFESKQATRLVGID